MVAVSLKKNGRFYYVNAEHPGVVLQRAGRAEFLSPGRFLRKLGVEDPESADLPFPVVEVQLEAGDVLFLGSDGRDDLDVGRTSDGQRIINEDEFLFVRTVERSGGKLEDLHAALLEAGVPTDDLSLMRIGYRERS